MVAVGLMALVSWTAWPDLPETVHGGRTNLDGTPNMVPRMVLVLALPLTTGFLAVALSVSAVVGPRFQGALHEALSLPGAPTARSVTRGMNAVLCLLSLFLLVTHGVLVLGQAGWDVPVARVTGVVVGLFLVGLGLALPRPEPRDGHDTPLVRWWVAAHRPMRIAIALVGLVQAAVVLLVDHALVWILAPLLLLPAMCAAMVHPVLRGRV
ncbi:hypothetical protein [Nocardiopsis halotolerans]|uniref:hypothetical protein n=1 Tax=Nocardiopsis halotolerans TaxID=124252 RepID=UPI0003769E6C|nr:hypothetical protein [Nocardiopsis halotolerans]